MKKIIIFPLLLIIFSSCSKKDRLATNTADIRIDPPYVRVITGRPVDLSAISTGSGSQGIDITPTWTVTPASIGAIAEPSTGKTARFTAGSSNGSGIIYAAYNDLRAQVNVLVVGTPYLLISDNASENNSDKIKTSGAPNYDIYQFFDTDDAEPWQIAVEDAPSGSGITQDSASALKVDYTNNAGADGYGGFFLEFITPQNLDPFTKLIFYVKTDGGTTNFLIKINDGGSADKYRQETAYGSWDKIEIPFYNFSTPVNSRYITKPFIIAFTHEVTGSDATVYIDYIGFE